MAEKLSICQVRLKPLPPSPTGELSDRVFRKCYFCEKNCESAGSHSIVDRLSGPGNFYCSFCLRHGLHTRGNRDILILSFRSIIGYFYLTNYVQAHGGRKLWITEIEDYIESHKQAGLANTLFLYDPETMLWFVNFARVGNSKRKVPVEEVYKTVVSILASFNLSETTYGVSMAALYAKYKDAIESFHRKRYRPENKRMLIPTLANTGVAEPKSCDLDRMRNFTVEDLRIKK